MSENQSQVLIRVLLVLGVVLGALSTLVGEEAEEQGGFLGSAACADCHPDHHDSWSETGHARTFQVASAESLPREMVVGADVPHPPGTSRFFRRDGGFFVTTMGPEGEPVEYPLTHVVGVRRIQMFLTRLPDGRLQVLPVMREAPTGEWFDYSHLIFGAGDPERAPKILPGEPTFWTGMTRFFDARCARCHTSGHESVEPGPDGVGDRSKWRARGIDCETCHGPGKDHADFWSKGAGDGVEKDPILDFGALSRERAAGVCLRCHMEGEMVRPDFAPGDDFFESFDPTLLDDEARVDPAGRPLELIYDGLPFLASECVTKGEMTCASCHDPHGGPYRSQLRSHPSSPDLCARCHEDVVAEGREHTRHDPAGVGASCTGCHMPPLSIERGHGIVTDHTVGVPNPGASGRRVAADACTTCHSGAKGAPGGVPRIAREKLLEAFGEWWPSAVARPAWASAIAAGREGGPEAAAGLIRLADDESAPRVARASAAGLMGRFPGETAPALLRLADHEDDLIRRAAVGALRSVVGPKADAVLQKALFSDSAAVRARAARAALFGWTRAEGNRSLLDALIPVLEEEASEVPDDDRTWFLLGAAHQIAGNLDAAVRAYDRKLALDPYAKHVQRTIENLRAEIERRDR